MTNMHLTQIRQYCLVEEAGIDCILFFKMSIDNWMSNQIYSQSWTVESSHMMSRMVCREFRVFYLLANVAISRLRHAPLVFLYTFD